MHREHTLAARLLQVVTTRQCFEFKTWQLFGEPALNDVTHWFYKEAAAQVPNHNLTRCKLNKCDLGETE